MVPKWRKDELTLKVFYNLSQREKEEYLELLEGMDTEHWGDTDIHILNFHSKEKINLNKNQEQNDCTN